MPLGYVLILNCVFRAYKHEVQASLLYITKYQKAVEEKDALLVEKEAKILKFEGNMLDKFEKLRKENSY